MGPVIADLDLPETHSPPQASRARFEIPIFPARIDFGSEVAIDAANAPIAFAGSNDLPLIDICFARFAHRCRDYPSMSCPFSGFAHAARMEWCKGERSG